MSKSIFRNAVGKMNTVKSRNMRTSSYVFSSTDTSHHRFNQDTTTASWDMAHRKQILQLNMTFIINGTQIDIIGVDFTFILSFM